MRRTRTGIALSVVLGAVVVAAFARPRAGPPYVDITWMSITNMYYELGPLRIVTDGYITRIPESIISRGRGDVTAAEISEAVEIFGETLRTI